MRRITTTKLNDNLNVRSSTYVSTNNSHPLNSISTRSRMKWFIHSAQGFFGRRFKNLHHLHGSTYKNSFRRIVKEIDTRISNEFRLTSSFGSKAGRSLSSAHIAVYRKRNHSKTWKGSKSGQTGSLSVSGDLDIVQFIHHQFNNNIADGNAYELDEFEQPSLTFCEWLYH